MDRKALLDKLAILQQELRDTGDVDDDETRRKLREVGDHIDQILDDDRDDPDPDTFAERLQDALYQFEATHPQLAKAMNNVLNTLSGMGI